MSTTEPVADNGVNVEHLLGARTALTDAPEAAEFTWRAIDRVGPRHPHRDHRGRLLGAGREPQPQDELQLHRRPPRGVRVRGQRRRPRSSTSSSAWRPA